MTVDEKGLEAAARAICQYENGSDCYGEAGKHAVNDYRKMALAAITAYEAARSAIAAARSLTGASNDG